MTSPDVPAAPPSDDARLAALLDVLDLRELSSGTATAPGGSGVLVDTSEDAFVTGSEPAPGGRVFGGQVLAQAIVAATRTVTDERSLHSMHGYFLRPGDPSVPIELVVERLRDGRSFSARRTHAVQGGKPILSMIASFQVADDGLEHAEPAMAVPAPETLPSTADLLGGVDHPFARYSAFGRPVDVRHVADPIYLRAAGEHVAHQAVWVRAVGTMPDDLALHRAVLAYISDLALLETVLRRHGLSWVSPGLKMASLDHAMWWHRPARVDEWLLYVQRSPSAQGGRALTEGRFFTRDGALVASVAQEGMVRAPS